MNARERLERIERELLAIQRALNVTSHGGLLDAETDIDDAYHILADAVVNYGAELEKVEVPGE